MGDGRQRTWYLKRERGPQGERQQQKGKLGGPGGRGEDAEKGSWWRQRPALLSLSCPPRSPSSSQISQRGFGIRRALRALSSTKGFYTSTQAGVHARFLHPANFTLLPGPGLLCEAFLGPHFRPHSPLLIVIQHWFDYTVLFLFTLQPLYGACSLRIKSRFYTSLHLQCLAWQLP